MPALRGERPQGRWKKLARLPIETRVVRGRRRPIGRTPASDPGDLHRADGAAARALRAHARGARARLRRRPLLFNSPKGRCVACEGKGSTKVEMQFLADLWLVCEECGGKRYAPEVLDVRWRGRTIADALELTAEEALGLLRAPAGAGARAAHAVRRRPGLPAARPELDHALGRRSAARQARGRAGARRERRAQRAGARRAVARDSRNRTCSTSRACSTAWRRAATP